MLALTYKRLNPPVTIEWDDVLDVNRGSVRVRRARIERKAYRNLFTDSGDVLWWPTISHGSPRIVDPNSTPTP